GRARPCSGPVPWTQLSNARRPPGQQPPASRCFVPGADRRASPARHPSVSSPGGPPPGITLVGFPSYLGKRLTCPCSRSRLGPGSAGVQGGGGGGDAVSAQTAP